MGKRIVSENACGAPSGLFVKNPVQNLLRLIRFRQFPFFPFGNQSPERRGEFVVENAFPESLQLKSRVCGFRVFPWTEVGHCVNKRIDLAEFAHFPVVCPGNMHGEPGFEKEQSRKMAVRSNGSLFIFIGARAEEPEVDAQHASGLASVRVHEKSREAFLESLRKASRKAAGSRARAAAV